MPIKTTKTSTSPKKTGTKKVGARSAAAKKTLEEKRKTPQAKVAPIKKESKLKRSPAKKPSPKSKKSALKSIPGHGLDLVRHCVKALDDKKAGSIEVIYVGENSSITDYFIIATGTSDPHLRALRIELEKAIDAVVPTGTIRVQNESNSGWCVVDAFDVVIHILSAEKRANYNLEALYSKGEKVNIKGLI